MTRAILLPLLLLAACSAAPAIDDTAAKAARLADYRGDAARGGRLFDQCRTCHSPAPAVNRTGPSLAGIVDRPAGRIAGFHYSPANRASGIVWHADRLFTYLRAPQEDLPGTFMSFAGLPDPQARADLVAYLKTLK